MPASPVATIRDRAARITRTRLMTIPVKRPMPRAISIITRP
jgi:hypothetical protein